MCLLFKIGTTGVTGSVTKFQGRSWVAESIKGVPAEQLAESMS